MTSKCRIGDSHEIQCNQNCHQSFWGLWDHACKIMLKATEDRISEMDWTVSKTAIRTSEDFKKATEEKMPICYYARNSKSHQDYMSLTNEFLDHLKIPGERYSVEVA